MNESTRDEPGLRAGVVGLGMIGGGVATSLARSGRTPLVYDIRPQAADLPGSPELASSPADVAARSDVVMVAVVSAEQALDVLNGEQGVLAAAHDGLTVVLLSTVSLASVRQLSDLCAERGVTLLDCGVTPGDKAAENGMVVMVGGDTSEVDRVRPVLDDFAKAVVHCGPLGAGMATKIARNIVTYGSWRTVSEAASLAESAGVDPQTLIQVIQTADPEGHTLLLLLQMQQNGDADAVGHQILPLMTKDLSAAQQLAADSGLRLPLVEASLAGASETLHLDPPDETERDGRQMMDEVYGSGFSQRVPEQGGAFMQETVDHLFGDIWNRPELSIRDRRLLVLGATAALGDVDLIRTQVRGALANQELTSEQLDEVVLHLAFYVGWGRATRLQEGISEALVEHRKDALPSRDS